jgi:hypothetical protein
MTLWGFGFGARNVYQKTPQLQSILHFDYAERVTHRLGVR